MGKDNLSDQPIFLNDRFLQHMLLKDKKQRYKRSNFKAKINLLHNTFNSYNLLRVSPKGIHHLTHLLEGGAKKCQIPDTHIQLCQLETATLLNKQYA